MSTKFEPVRWGLHDIVWPVLLGMALMHAMAIGAPFFFSWSGVAICLLLYWVSGGLGITLCYHRLLTHRSFRTPKWFEYVLTLCALSALQGGIISWVGNHRLHHAHSDEVEDPHTPRHGEWWSHVIWIFVKRPESGDPRTVTKDLQRDPVMMWLDRFFWLPQTLIGIGLFFGGWWYKDIWLGTSWILWGVGMRTAMVYHATWLVNSAGHLSGYRNFNTTDDSRNNWLVALFSFGEGWHNNHHAQQRSAAHGMRWFEFDMTYWTILLLGCVRLARDIQPPDREKLRAEHADIRKTKLAFRRNEAA